MTAWSKLTPRNAPKPIETARGQVEKLGRKLVEADAAIAEARATLEAAEQEDTKQMSIAVRAGRSPVSDATQVDQARDALATAERTRAAVQLAIDEAESDLFSEIERNRERWLADATKDVERGRERARELLDQLGEVLAQIHSTQIVIGWLQPGSGFDRERPPAGIGVASAPSSRRRTANGEPLTLEEVLAYMSELVAPPVRTREPVAAS